jgi:hypothetical protein
MVFQTMAVCMQEQTSISVFDKPGWEADGNGMVYFNGHKPKVHINHGYQEVSIAGQNHKKAVLVCTAWHGPKPFEYAEVRHLNDNRMDDSPGNLAWGTHSQNMLDAYRNGKMSDRNGEKNGQAKLTECEVIKIRDLYAHGGYSYGKLASMYGIHFITIRDIVKRYKWRHI